jgi:hypothetical protein
MHDRRLETARELDQFRVSSGAAGTPEDGHALRRIEERRQRRDLGIRRTEIGPRLLNRRTRAPLDGVGQGHIAGDRDHRDPWRESAVWIAMSRTCGIWSGCEISSQ